MSTTAGGGTTASPEPRPKGHIMKTCIVLAGLATIACGEIPQEPGDARFGATAVAESSQAARHTIRIATCGTDRILIVKVSLTQPAEITWPAGWQPVIERAWWRRIWRWVFGDMTHTALAPRSGGGEQTISVTLSESVTGLAELGPLHSLAYCERAPKPTTPRPKRGSISEAHVPRNEQKVGEGGWTV
jgi:hypothetical protein